MGRSTIGLLTHGAGDPNNRAIWAGVADVAREQGANLICFPGKPLRSALEFEAQSNVIFDLVNAGNVDGLVLWLAGLTLRVDLEEIRRFSERYRPLPIVGVGSLMEDIPCVMVDNYHGMRDVVEHLLSVHSRRRIAFVRGPQQHQEAEQRYQAYLDTLAEHDIAFDPALVVVGNFKESGGSHAVAELLDRRGARFDALVAASDNMAIGAMKALQARGVRIPDDVALAGLNDEAQSRVVSPPLTTGPLHFYEQARQATLMVLALILGEVVPERVTIPTRLLVRQSCGCPAPSLARAGLDPPSRASSPALKERASGLPLLASEELGEASAPQWFDRVQAAFLAELSGEAPGQFLAALADEVRQATWAGDEASRWNNVISSLRHSVLAGHATEEERRQAERLCHQARVLIGETAQRGQAYQTLQGEDKLRTLSQINQNLSITTSLEELAQVLVNTLRLLHIPCCYLALYEDPQEPANWSRLIMAYDEMGNYELEAGGVRFPSRQVIPDGFLPADRRYSLVVEPLYFKEDQLGFVLFEADPYEDEIYEILAGQISGALKRTILTERNIRLYTEAVEARKSAEEANLLKSRFLSMVSHELRTPLSLIVGTIEMMLQEERASGTPPLPETYRQDMDCAHTAAQHLFRLIGDVLDLASSQAGELRLACEPLNLSKILHEVALLGESLAREKDLAWQAAIPQRLPVVWGDRTRLRQVTLNLVSNAVKFTERGRVELGVQVGEQDVTVTVSDTGMGIPLEEQVTIFDEFRRSERSLRRGYGGIGLGLAISRRLVELHGGVIGVCSSGEEESGSTFYYKLPVLAVTQSEEDAAPPSRSVLLLAERAQRSRILRDHLVRRGYEVEVLGLEETPDWLPRVTAAPPGAIVLDYQPAAEQGWEMIQLLKQGSTTRDIPVIFYSYFQERERGSLLEMDYLTKPLRQAELLQALDRLALCDEEDLRTILVVDDESAILDLHIRLLQGHLPDCHILGARDGQEALSVIEQSMPDLVLLDLMMPEMDGFQVLEAMRDRELSRHIPVIVLTAQLLTRLDMARLQQGVAAVLAKGVFSGEEVLAQVEAALARNKRLGSEAQRILRQAMAYINEHYAQPISRKDLASQLAVSDNYLTRCFRQELGITPTTYVNRRRVQQAKAIFQQGQVTVTEVALAVGFSDSNYFARVFRKEEGVTPSAYVQGKRPGA